MHLSPPGAEYRLPRKLCSRLSQVYSLKVTIDLPEGLQSIWRKIEIRGEASLVELGDAIQACFAWSGTHKHEWIASDNSWKATSTQYGPPEFDDYYKDEEEVRQAQDMIKKYI